MESTALGAENDPITETALSQCFGDEARWIDGSNLYITSMLPEGYYSFLGEDRSLCTLEMAIDLLRIANSLCFICVN